MHLAGGPDLKARWTDNFSGLLPDSLGRWLPLFPIFPGSVPVHLVLTSLSVHSAIPHAPAFPAYQRNSKHVFTECSKLFPLVTTIYKLLVANGHREVTIECHMEIVGIIVLSIDDMFQ